MAFEFWFSFAPLEADVLGSVMTISFEHGHEQNRGYKPQNKFPKLGILPYFVRVIGAAHVAPSAAYLNSVKEKYYVVGILTRMCVPYASNIGCWTHPAGKQSTVILWG